MSKSEKYRKRFDKDSRHLNQELPDFRKYSGGEVPENYFEELPGRIMEKIKKENPDTRNTVHLKAPNWYYAAAAAILILLSVSTILIINQKAENDIQPMVEEISSEEFIEYLLTAELYESEIIDYLMESSEVAIFTDDDIQNFSSINDDTSLSEEDLYNYLLEQDIDETQLMEL